MASELPRELLFVIFAEADSRELASYSLVCPNWRRVAQFLRFNCHFSRTRLIIDTARKARDLLDYPKYRDWMGPILSFVIKREDCEPFSIRCRAFD